MTSRIVDHLEPHEAADAAKRVGEILEDIQIPARSPSIGRPVGGGKRERVIGQGNRGYMALHRYLAGIETVFILALRAQGESGFKH